jgi:hypothetical protein
MEKRLLLVGVLVVVVFLVSVLVFAAMQTTLTLPGTSTITTTGELTAYQDANLTTPATSFSWGQLFPAQHAYYMVYIKNNHPEVAFTLNMSVSDWSPSDMAEYCSLTWNCTGYSLAPLSSVCAYLTLCTFENATATSFSFNIIITGSSP